MRKKVNLFSILILAIISCTNKEFIEPYAKSEGGNPKLINFNPNLTYGTVTDIDGNVYKTIQIGTQTWMAENLRVSKYRNGALIQNIQNDNQWATLTTGAWCNYNNETKNDKEFGKMYNWFAAVDSRSICPIGWHMPSSAEWSILESFLGGVNIISPKLRETETKHWVNNDGATNSSGFTALPGGLRNNVGDGKFYDFGIAAPFWSSTSTAYGAYIARITKTNAIDVYQVFSISKTTGAYIRCIKD